MTAGMLSLELLLMGAGIFARKSHIVGLHFNEELASLITKLALPCLIVDSMRGTASLSELQNCGILLVLALVTLGIELLLGQGTYLLAGRTSSGRIFRFGMTYTNFTFMGIPVVEALFGSQGVFYFVVFLVPIRIVYYSTAKLMLSPPGITHGKQTFLQHLRGWLSPPVVAVLVGLVLYLTGWHLPTVLDDVVHSVGSICSPLGMLLCGISLGEYPFRQLLRRKYLLLPLVRDLALPGLLLLLTRLLPVENQLSNLMVIYAALPISSMMAAFTLQYDPAPEAHFESAGVVLLSTLLSALTIPLWAWVMGL